MLFATNTRKIGLLFNQFHYPLYIAMSAIPNNFDRIVNDQGEVVWTFKGLARPKLIIPFRFRGIIELTLALIAFFIISITALTSNNAFTVLLFFAIFMIGVRFFFKLKEGKKITLNGEFLKFDNTSLPLKKIQDLGIATNVNKAFKSIAYIYAIVQGSEVVIASGENEVMQGLLYDIVAILNLETTEK